MPYYLLPYIPIVLAPIFISLSDLSVKKKIFYSVYPTVLFVLVYFIFLRRTSIPRHISFERKGWHTIVYDVDNEEKLKRKNGYREIKFTSDVVLLTSTEQMDIIPVSESKYSYRGIDDSYSKEIICDSEIQYKRNSQDSNLYIYYELRRFGNKYCSLGDNNDISMETFFIGTKEEYFNRDSIYPLKEVSNEVDRFFKNYCEKK